MNEWTTSSFLNGRQENCKITPKAFPTSRHPVLFLVIWKFTDNAVWFGSLNSFSLSLSLPQRKDVLFPLLCPQNPATSKNKLRAKVLECSLTSVSPRTMKYQRKEERKFIYSFNKYTVEYLVCLELKPKAYCLALPLLSCHAGLCLKPSKPDFQIPGENASGQVVLGCSHCESRCPSPLLVPHYLSPSTFLLLQFLSSAPDSCPLLWA